MVLLRFAGFLIGSALRLIFAIVYIVIGWWSVAVLLELLWRGSQPFWIEIVAGILLGSITIPLAIIGLVLQALGIIQAPLLHTPMPGAPVVSML
jgi:hypothetical protein